MLGRKNKEKVAIPVSKDVVRVSEGAGVASKDVSYITGDTVKDILRKANIQVPEGKVVTLGSKVVKDMETKVAGGDILVVSSAPSNG